MIIKPTGRTVVSADGAINYLGTTDDKTKAHQNPGLTKYRQARRLYNKTHLNKYRQMMSKYKVFTHRDMYTFGNFDTHSTKAIKAEIQKFMSHNSRKVQTREFVIMPSDTDNVKATDPHSVYEFYKFVRKYIKRHFKDNFHYYAVIAPDSRTNSRVHAHIVVVNDDLSNGKAMAGHYYNIHGKNGLWSDLKKSTKDYGYSVPNTTMKPHQPSKMEKSIIGKARKAFAHLNANPEVARKITSRPKLIDYLKGYNLKANYRNTKRHYKKKTYHVKGWKFKLLDGKRHPYVKASRVSKAKGGAFLSTSNLATVLSSDRRLNARLKRQPKRAKSVAPQSASSNQPTQSELANAMLRQNIQSEMDEPTPTPSYSAPKPSSDSSSTVSQEQSKSQSEDTEEANKQNNEAQQSADNQRLQDELVRKSSAAVKSSKASRKAKMSSHAQDVKTAYASAKASAFASSPNEKQSYIQRKSDAKSMDISPKQSKMINDFDRSDGIRHHAFINNLHEITNHHQHVKGDPGYTYWYWQHAIPARVVGYDGDIPIFGASNNPKNVSWLHKITAPIIRGFKRHLPHVYEKFVGGMQAIKNYGDINGLYYRKSISDYADDGNKLGKPFRKHKANIFKEAWHGIEFGFHRIIRPMINKFYRQSDNARSASKASESISVARSNSVADLNQSNTVAVNNMQRNWKQAKSSISQSDMAWNQSYALTTPLGKYAKSAVSAGVKHMYSARDRINSAVDSEKSAGVSLIPMMNKYMPAQMYLEDKVSNHEIHVQSIKSERKTRENRQRANSNKPSHDKTPKHDPNRDGWDLE